MRDCVLELFLYRYTATTSAILYIIGTIYTLVLIGIIRTLRRRSVFSAT